MFRSPCGSLPQRCLMDSPYLGFYVMAFALLACTVILLGRWAYQTFRRRSYKNTEDTSDSIIPSVPNSVMEQYELHRRERRRLGLCLHCSEKPTHQIPEFQIVRSAWDTVLLYLGAHQQDRWRVSTWIGAERPPELCANHHERNRGLLEERLAKHNADRAKFTDGERKDLYEYQVATVFEIMSDDMKQLRMGKKQKAKLAIVQPLKAVVNGNS